MTEVGGAVEEVARLVWEAEGADILPVGSGGAVGVLGRWLRGGDAERAEDVLLASYHLYDKDLLALAPAIARWVGVGPVSAHVRRLLGMVPVKELRPVLVPALAARLRGEPDPHGPLHSACTDLLEHLGLGDEVRLLTDPDFHGSRTPPPEAPGEPGDDGPGPVDEGAIAQAVRRSAHFMRRAAVAAAPLAGNPDVVALIEGRLGTRSGKHNPGSLRAAYMLPDDDLLALVPAIVRWVDVERGALYAHRLLRMLPISRLRPVLVPAAFAWLHEGEMMDYVSWCTFASLFDSLGLDEDLRRMADLALAHTDPDVRTAGKEIVEDFLQD